MEIGFTTTFAISVYHHWSCEFESCSWRGVLDKTLCDKGCQWLPTGRWFSPGTPVSSTNKADQHDITEILLKHQNTNPNLFAYSRFDYIIMFFLLQNYFPLRRAKCHFMQSSIKIASILLKNLYSILML
jgi:hypothetical protein